MLSTGKPCGCGCSIRGGGIVGPEGGPDKVRAGEDGEYHHSRNLMKKIHIGNNTFREFRRSLGEDISHLRKATSTPLFRSFIPDLNCSVVLAFCFSDDVG